MNLFEKKTIYYSQNNCNPFVRSILKSVFLVDNIELIFIKNIENTVVIRGRKEDLGKLIDKISCFNQAEQILKNNVLMGELKKFVRHKMQVKKSISTIMEYLYSDKEEVKKKSFVKRWIYLYGEKNQFRFKGSADVNAVNYNETPTYLKLFQIQKESSKHMENATATLLETIPCDVETIADVGAGPGLVNQYIPYYYDVLAIDINQEILDQNSRKTCIGDILDLPLQDQSVDMTITCDVLEHLESDKLEKAVSELRRVSKKYIYIQVPYNEILRYSIAKCPECGNIWHVNFHKNRFTLNTLKQYENEEWKISQVNYTGNVDNEIENPEIYEKIVKEGLEIYRVENFECPKCGAKSKTVNIDMLYNMFKNDNIQKESKRIMPKYSEIGVLFEKENKNNGADIVETAEYNSLNEKQLYSNVEIDFARKFMIKSVYSGKEQVPAFFLGSSEIEMLGEGIFIKGNCNSWIGIALPYIIEGDELEIEGSSHTDTKIIIVGVDKEEKEFQEEQVDIKEGDFVYRHKMSSKWKEHSTFLKLYFEDEILLSFMRVHRKDKRNYYFINQNDIKGAHYIISQGGVLYRYYIPEQGVAFVQNKSGLIEVG